MVVKNILLIVPIEANDAFTEEFSSVAAEKVKNKAVQSGFNVIELEGSEAIRANVDEVFNTIDVHCLIHYGHGDPNEMRGILDEEVVNKDNISKMNGKTISTVSCETTQILGSQDFQDLDTGAYLGYREKYYVYTGLEWILNQVIQSSIVANEKLLEGKTCKQAYDSQVDAYNTLKMQLFQRYADTDDYRYMIAAICTEFNCASLEKFGKDSAKI